MRRHAVTWSVVFSLCVAGTALERHWLAMGFFCVLLGFQLGVFAEAKS